jgi:hypothetical protein
MHLQNSTSFHDNHTQTNKQTYKPGVKRFLNLMKTIYEKLIASMYLRVKDWTLSAKIEN